MVYYESMNSHALSLFSPPVRNWFSTRFNHPSPIQEKAWPVIARGEHALICAPTGSGKTLTAFLWAIDRLLNHDSGSNRRILYISPLKALNSDIELNLRTPLAEIRDLSAEPLREIHVGVRSGDTSSSERRHQDRRPPDIFITTPESLGILMSRNAWPTILTGISTVIVDEVHSLVGSKRGALLMGLMELLVEKNGPVQRLALSATINPADVVARWFAGWEGDGSSPVLRRPIHVVEARHQKKTEITLDRPDTSGMPLYGKLADWLVEQFNSDGGVLLFANSRRQVERVAHWINEKADPSPLVFAHHGSLAKEIRHDVEHRFRTGAIRGVVATNSLELGIDIGSVERVILLGTPWSVASTLQRIGRSGHRLDAVSQGLLVPWHRLDHLYGLIMSEMALMGEIEEIKPLICPLDVLAQLLLNVLAAGIEPITSMQALFRRSEAFHALPEADLTATLELLAGRVRENRHPALAARIHYRPQDGLARLRPHARLLLMQAGGVIADRGYFIMRQADTDEKIGELDEEFVWERNLGDVFPFASRLWRLVYKDAREVKVMPEDGRGGLLPFWRADAADRDGHFCQRVLDVLDGYDGTVESLLRHDKKPNCRPQVAQGLIRLLEDQQKAWGCLPGRKRVVLETRSCDDQELMLFTLRGGRFNRSLALVLDWLIAGENGSDLSVLANNEGIMIRTPGVEALTTRLLQEISEAHVDKAFHDCLPRQGVSAAVFREQAQVAMLIPRSMPGRRGPLWWRRQRSVRLMQDLGSEEGCILLQGCYRETLWRYYDLEAVREWIRLLRRGEITWRMVRLPQPSPLAADLVWQNENELMYRAEQASPAAKPSWNLLLPQLDETPVFPFTEEQQERFLLEKWRFLDGMEPGDEDELKLWLEERRLIPLDLWNRMQSRYTGENMLLWQGFAAGKTALLDAKGKIVAYAHSERMASLLAQAQANPQQDAQIDFLLEWLRFFPSLTPRDLSRYWGWPEDQVRSLLNRLSSEQLFISPDGERFALYPVINQLWQRCRLERRQGLMALNTAGIHRFFIRWQETQSENDDDGDHLRALLYRSMLMPLPWSVWMDSYFPRRCPAWHPSGLSDLIRREGILIGGDEQGRIVFLLSVDLDLIRDKTRGEWDEQTTAVMTVIDTSVGEVSSHDLAQAIPRLSHNQVLGALKALFFGGCIVGTDLDGVEVLLKAEGSLKGEGEQIAGSGWSKRRMLRKAVRPSRISRGWRRITFSSGELTALDRMEAVKDWLRLVMERHGIFFPELLVHQAFAPTWAELRRALSQMEWAGELVSGYFVKGARTPQYLLPAALDAFADKSSGTWRLEHSAEPTSACGMDNGGFRSAFPFSRNFGWLVTHDGQWGLALSQSTRRLRINDTWSPEALDQALKVLITEKKRFLTPNRSGLWILEDIDGGALDDQTIRSLLTRAGFRREMNDWVLPDA